MSNEIVTDYGTIEISKEVIASLAGLATTGCMGVVGVVSAHWSMGINELLGKESLSKGVEVNTDGEAIQIRVNIVVAYGNRISTIAENITGSVRYLVEKYTGLTVKRVEVSVRDVRMID